MTQVRPVFLPPSSVRLFLCRRPSIAVMLLQGEAMPEQEATLQRMDVAEECVSSLNRHDYTNGM
jgi:hypothetical protein